MRDQVQPARIALPDQRSPATEKRHDRKGIAPAPPRTAAYTTPSHVKGAPPASSNAGSNITPNSRKGMFISRGRYIKAKQQRKADKTDIGTERNQNDATAMKWDETYGNAYHGKHRISNASTAWDRHQAEGGGSLYLTSPLHSWLIYASTQRLQAARADKLSLTVLPSANRFSARQGAPRRAYKTVSACCTGRLCDLLATCGWLLSRPRRAAVRLAAPIVLAAIAALGAERFGFRWTPRRVHRTEARSQGAPPSGVLFSGMGMSSRAKARRLGMNRPVVRDGNGIPWLGPAGYFPGRRRRWYATAGRAGRRRGGPGFFGAPSRATRGSRWRSRAENEPARLVRERETRAQLARESLLLNYCESNSSCSSSVSRRSTNSSTSRVMFASCSCSNSAHSRALSIARWSCSLARLSLAIARLLLSVMLLSLFQCE